jgi:hypothetical protein
MARHPAQQHISFEQYLLLVRNSDRRYEYYDGEVRLMAGGSSVEQVEEEGEDMPELEQ